MAETKKSSSLKKKAKARAKSKTSTPAQPAPTKAEQKAPKDFMPPMSNSAPPLPPALTYLRKLATIPSLRQKG